ncbi:hypothetical protein MNBD_NITROSPINAE03-531 [hydrothermal vent metagenome]|uniref:Uncharacterized protein n=1 Tax=hydrothermal vent metagenome TaxID=652676 RepID=A0A3B1BZK6_9ZZZZ
MNRMKAPFQVSFLPWAGLEEEIQIGPITFWPFHTKAEENINEKCIKDQLKRILKSYVDHKGDPVKTITICSHGAHDFRELRKKEFDELVCAVDALIFATICPTVKHAICNNNRSMGPPSADRYQLITQNFTPGINDISIRAGNTLHGGWKIGDVTFTEPWHMGGYFASQDKELLKGLGKVLDDNFSSGIRDRIFRSLEWFRLAHTQSDVVSELSKVVMMATAFEIVLQVSKNGGKKREIAKKLEKRFKNDLSIEEEKTTRKGTVTFPKISCWAWDFYELRNEIVHGDNIDPKRLGCGFDGREWLTHSIIADLVYLQIIVNELFTHKLIGEAERDFNAKLAGDKPESYECIMMDSMLDFSDVHKTLGWENERSIE